MVSNALPTAGEVIASKYVVERIIGSGGMGVVMVARHVQLGHRVAIKFLRRDNHDDGAATTRFLREARAAVAITSEHVAKVLDVGTLEDGEPYIVMEFLDGTDLAVALKRVGKMPTEEAVDTVLQACEALAEAHALGIVHRDLKPSNLFVARRADGTTLIKVLDFGISKRADLNTEGAREESLTASGHVVGSPEYMSPEQVRNAKGVDARGDIWALGVILYELLTGGRPFVGQTLGDTLAKIVTEAPTSIRSIRPDVPVALAALVRRCLERDVARRVQSIGELAAGLRPFAPSGSDARVERILRIAVDARSAAPVRNASAFASAVTEEVAITASGPEAEAGKVETTEAWLQPGRRGGSRSGSTNVPKAMVLSALFLLTAFAIVGVLKSRARMRVPSASVAGNVSSEAAVASPPPLSSASVPIVASATSSFNVRDDAGPPKSVAPLRTPPRRPTPPPRPSATTDEPNPDDLLERRR